MRKKSNTYNTSHGFFLIEVAYAGFLLCIMFSVAIYLHSVYSKAFFMIVDEYEQLLLFDAYSQKLMACKQSLFPSINNNAECGKNISCNFTYDSSSGVYRIILSAKSKKGVDRNVEYIFCD